MSQDSTGSLILPSRQVATGDPAGDSLENVNTNVLGDGAICYVESGPGQGEWQLQKASTDTPDGTTIVAPTAGPGRWFIKSLPGAITPPSMPLPAPILTTLIQGAIPGTIATFVPYLGDYLYTISFFCGLIHTGLYAGAPLEVIFGAEPGAGTFAEVWLPAPIAPNTTEAFWLTVSGHFRFNAVDATPVTIISGAGGRNVDPAPEILQWVTSGVGDQVLIIPVQEF